MVDHARIEVTDITSIQMRNADCIEMKHSGTYLRMASHINKTIWPSPLATRKVLKNKA